MKTNFEILLYSFSICLTLMVKTKGIYLIVFFKYYLIRINLNYNFKIVRIKKLIILHFRK